MMTRSVRIDLEKVSEVIDHRIDRDIIIDRGLCHRADLDDDVFFPSEDVFGYGIRKARADNHHSWFKAAAICGECPVRIMCLAYAISNPQISPAGMWGGRTPRERREIRQALGSQTAMLSSPMPNEKEA